MDYFGTGNTDFGSSINVNTAVGLATYAAANGIGNTHNQCTSLPAVSQRHQRVSSFT